ncbi:iron-sulfur cluster biosynthesis family protein [Lacticaseibacillus absianus]|uniref:iron-sulfur cluster biosynthesis family protein n=1 Tax=Lacticaseibacillus absianus TaxID=2729623 RepID=UPI0015C7BF72|nr:iron-sulfur cluster biosynthesis family protein [Lacticaseibacillus absianus]
MELNFDPAATAKVQPHLGPQKQLLLTFEDGVGPYSQHAMIHMQIQFTLNVVAVDADISAYDTVIDSTLGPIRIKGYSSEDLDPHLTIHLNPTANTMSLSGDSGIIDPNLGFIDFTTVGGPINPAR